MVIIVITTSITARNSSPEKSGSPAIDWATPSVYGFIIEPVNPAAAPTRTTATATIESNFIARHMLTIIGM